MNVYQKACWDSDEDRTESAGPFEVIGHLSRTTPAPPRTQLSFLLAGCFSSVSPRDVSGVGLDLLISELGNGAGRVSGCHLEGEDPGPGGLWAVETAPWLLFRADGAQAPPADP